MILRFNTSASGLTPWLVLFWFSEMFSVEIYYIGEMYVSDSKPFKIQGFGNKLFHIILVFIVPFFLFKHRHFTVVLRVEYGLLCKPEFPL